MATEQQITSHERPRRAAMKARSVARHGNGRRVAGIRAPFNLDDAQLTQTLAWASVGLGLTEILAPRLLSKAIGVGEHAAVFRALGAREIASGVGLMTQQKAGSWAWSRVAGDVIDLALLAAATRAPGTNPQRIAMAAIAILGVTALDVYSGQRLMQSRLQTEPTRIEVSHALTVNTKPETLYAFLRQLDNLPLFIRHLRSVDAVDERVSHWVMSVTGDRTIEWDAEITQDVADKRIAWRALPGADMRHSGSVTLDVAPASRGTVVRVELQYEPPAGVLGKNIAMLLGREPGQQLKQDLLRLKQLVETGEIATSSGQSHGERSFLGRKTLGRWLS